MDHIEHQGEHRGEHGSRHEPSEADAAEAFEALRAEVVGLRRGLERLDGLVREGWREQAEAREEMPDYTPTLGAMAQELAEARERLAAIEGKPALALTPAGFQAELKAAVGAATTLPGMELRVATGQAKAVAGELEGLVGRVRARDEQRAWLWTAGLCGAMAGVLLWIVAVGVLPRGAGHWLATLLVGGGQWQAGAELMQGANPVGWDRVARLDRACGEVRTELCEAALAVRTSPPGAPAQPGPEEARATQPIRPPPPSTPGRLQR